MKAREFLAQKVGADGVVLRHIIKEPLSVDELRKLAAQAGGARELIAPKKRAEAEGIEGDKLLKWLAEDGGRVRRPIVIAGKKVVLGFAGDAREALESLL